MSEQRIPMKNYWMGEVIDDMPRERLLEIIDFLGRELSELRSPRRNRAYALGSVEMMKRGENSLLTSQLHDWREKSK